MFFPEIRLRRLRRTPAIRALLDAPLPPPGHFIWPLFVVKGEKRCEAIEAMPGQYRLSLDMLLKKLEPVVAQGIGGVLLFGQAEDGKDFSGSAAYDEHGVVQRAVAGIKRAFPDLVVMTDVCLCAYTAHGHCGLLDQQGHVINDATNELLARVAVSHAMAGADVVAPSAMMDGQVAAIREALGASGFEETLLMAYAAKFASSFYAPFREAEKSAPSKGDRQAYQASCRNLRGAWREAEFDEHEGADILMVKPAMLYLDVLAGIRARTNLPVAAYNVSGEYSMLMATAERGWGDLLAMARESLLAIDRAGADLLITYWAPRYREIFGDVQ